MDTIPLPSRPISDPNKKLVYQRAIYIGEYNELNEKWNELRDHERDLAIQGKGKDDNIELLEKKKELYIKIKNLALGLESPKPKEIKKIKKEVSAPREIIQVKRDVSTGTVPEIKVPHRENTEKAIKPHQQPTVKKIGRDTDVLVEKISFSPFRKTKKPVVTAPKPISKEINQDTRPIIEEISFSPLQKFKKEEISSALHEREEKRGPDQNMEGISSSFQRVVALLDERRSKGFDSIFINEETYKALIPEVDAANSKNEIKEILSLIGINMEKLAVHKRVSDNPNSLEELARVMHTFLLSVKDVTTKIQDEDDKKELAYVLFPITNKIQRAHMAINKKAKGLRGA
jgi:hypothetical protein